MNYNKISLKEIAEACKCSKTTASWVLNGKAEKMRISKVTSERILAYAQKHNYRPNHQARSLALGKSNTIALIVPDIADTFYAQIAKAVERKASEYGYSILFSSSEGDSDKEINLIDTMLHKQVDGLLIATTKLNTSSINNLMKSNYPFVLVDRYYPEIDTNYVIQNNSKGTKDLYTHINRQGAKRVAFITTETHLTAMQERLQGYIEAANELNIDVDSDLIVEIPIDRIEESIDIEISKLINLDSPIDAIIFSTHYLAISGLKVLNRLDREIKSRVLIASYGDNICFEVVTPNVTVCRVSHTQIGERAVETLINNIELPDSKDYTPEHIVIDPVVIERESTLSNLED